MLVILKKELCVMIFEYTFSCIIICNVTCDMYEKLIRLDQLLINSVRFKHFTIEIKKGFK